VFVVVVIIIVIICSLKVKYTLTNAAVQAKCSLSVFVRWHGAAVIKKCCYTVEFSGLEIRHLQGSVQVRSVRLNPAEGIVDC